jgi:hypothetical protein
MDGRKQAVSIRLNSADLRNVKKLSKRLGVRYSDVIRYAVKSTLAKLGPLFDAETRGRNLVPVFVEAGTDMVRYLDLDAARLETIINDGASEDARVDHADIQLLAMSGIQQSYARIRLTHIGTTRNNGAASADREKPNDDEPLVQSLRRYLYDKYVYENHRMDLTSLAERGNKL